MKHLHYRFTNGARSGYDYADPDVAAAYFDANGVLYSREDDTLNTWFTVYGYRRPRAKRS